MGNLFVSYSSPTSITIPNCDNISVHIPQEVFISYPTATTICFRVGGQSCCLSEGTGDPQPIYSNEVCIDISSYYAGVLSSFDFNQSV